MTNIAIARPHQPKEARNRCGMARTIGEILKTARREAGLTARSLSRLTGIPTGYLSQIETGARRDPGFSMVLKIARAIGISMEDLAIRLEGGTSIISKSTNATNANLLARLEQAEAQSLRTSQLLTSTVKAMQATIQKPGNRKKIKR